MHKKKKKAHNSNHRHPKRLEKLHKNTGPLKVITGTITLTQKGVGYLEIEGSEEDVEIQPEKTLGAFPKDEVEAVIVGKRFGRTQGEVRKILKRAKSQFVGTLHMQNGKVFLIPDDYRINRTIFVRTEGKITPDTKALVKIIKWNGENQNGGDPEGEIIKLLGLKGTHDVEMESIVLEKGFDIGFPDAVTAEAAQIEKTEKPIPEDEIKKRRDMRSSWTCTIDPIDAKDFDDAISLKKLDENLFEIGVHIANVSHYVREKTALDREAAKRGFSVYLVDRTIPMLPHVLSNDICSLNPNEDKLTFSAVFEMDRKGNVHKRWFGKTVIHSAKRFSYESAQECLDGKTGEHYEKLKTLLDIAKELAEDKFSAGALDFEKDEVRFELDAKGKPIRVYKKERLETHKLVEDYMLLANREVAEYIVKENAEKHRKEGAFIYRVHDLPNEEKLADLSLFIKALGYDLESHGGKVTSKAIRKLLTDVTGKPYESLIKTATIRSMAKAIYSTQNIGHFGLAFKYYTHFTSPIRRYPDLLVHRVLEKYLERKAVSSDEMAYYNKMAAQSTKREIEAAEAERASIKYKQVEYMSEHIGEEFNGIISGITEWGIYLEEEETKCEGMARLRDITDDYYIFDAKHYALIGEKTKKKLALGDKVRFKVMKADLERKTLDYKIVS